MFKTLADDGNPHPYAKNAEEIVDAILDEIGFVSDKHTTWWEVTDSLFFSGDAHEAMLAQRHAMLMADAVFFNCSFISSRRFVWENCCTNRRIADCCFLTNDFKCCA